MPFFEDISLLPDDPILSLTDRFNQDSRTNKVNLGVGTYKTAEGSPYVLPVVEEAERRILSKHFDKEYLPISGSLPFIDATHDLLFGSNSPVKDRTCGVQTIGGSGALRIGGEFLAKQQCRTIYLPQPSWGNHEGIFTRAGLICKQYPYYNNQSHQIEFNAWCEAIAGMEPRSVILLHTCCHNPTGMDPTQEQWKKLSKLILDKELFPFFDIAYQGFDVGLEEDAWPIRYFAHQGHPLFVASSYSKNMGLYNERVGSLFSVVQTMSISDRLRSQLRAEIRGNYSNPPAHGAQIVTCVLQTPALRQQWEGELQGMCQRIKKMRVLLADKLKMARPDINMDFIREQRGIFSYSGLGGKQVEYLMEHFGLYMPPNGRINIAGLNEGNIDYVVKAFAETLS